LDLLARLHLESKQQLSHQLVLNLPEENAVEVSSAKAKQGVRRLNDIVTRESS
jgi:hypothetical protein